MTRLGWKRRLEFEEVAEANRKEKAAKLAEAIKEDKATKCMLNEVNEAMEVGTIGNGHGKTKYMVPARRK